MFKLDKKDFNEDTINKIKRYLKDTLRFIETIDKDYTIYDIDLPEVNITFKIPKKIDYSKDTDRALISFQLESLARAYSRDSKDLFDEIINNY